MIAVKARFDGKKIVLPQEVHDAPPGEVIVIFADSPDDRAEKKAWMKAQESAFAKAWDNDEDAVYDSL